MFKQKSIKSFISIICILALILSLCAGLISCGSEDSDSEKDAKGTQQQETSGEPDGEPAPEPETKPAEPTTERPTPEPTEPPRPSKPIEENHVLRVKTGKNQWEGIKVTGEKMNLEMDKSYSFSMLVYSPDIEVGLVFQANTVNGWNWNTVASIGAYSLDPPGWYELSGTLNLDNDSVTGLPTLALAKAGDGGDMDSLVTIFYVDDFVVTDLETGEIVCQEDFEGETSIFENNGGTRSLVPESDIYEAAG